MNEGDMEYLISELILDTRSMMILMDLEEGDCDNNELIKEHIQLLHINRELAINELMGIK